MPEAAIYLRNARQDLDEARQIAGIGLAKVAARSSYYAAFHAAEAYILERSGRVAKSHSGVRTEFQRLAKDDPAIPAQVVKFLPTAYRFKEISDYGRDPVAAITMEDAEDAIEGAAAFIKAVEVALEPAKPG